MSPPPGIREDDDGAIVTWSLCDPPRRNPVSPAMLDWIAARCVALAGRIVVIRGDGRRVFCAGFDLDALAAAPSDALPDAPLGRAVAAMRSADVTFVAAIEGVAIGAGVELACACDLRIGGPAAAFEVPAARLGVIYRADGLALLQQAFGPSGLRRLVLLGERLDARAAAACGALDVILDAEAFDDALAAVLTRLHGSDPGARQGNRDALRRGVPRVDDSWIAEHDARRSTAFANARARLAARDRGLPKRPTEGLGSGAMATTIKDDIEARLKQARRDRDEATLNVIGMLKSKVLNELKSGSGAVEDDALWLAVIGAYVKLLRKSIADYEKAGERGREALEGVQFEIRFCEQFLPSRLDEAATEALVRKLVADNGLAGQGGKATGRVMGLLMKDHKDTIDADLAKTVVARVLAESHAG